MPTHLRGYMLLNAAVKQIEKHPETWNQDCPIIYRDCPRCVLAHVVVLGGYRSNYMGYSVADKAQELCGLTWGEANRLFRSANTLKRIKTIAKRFEIKSKKHLK